MGQKTWKMWKHIRLQSILRQCCSGSIDGGAVVDSEQGEAVVGTIKKIGNWDYAATGGNYVPIGICRVIIETTNEGSYYTHSWLLHSPIVAIFDFRDTAMKVAILGQSTKIPIQDISLATYRVCTFDEHTN